MELNKADIVNIESGLKRLSEALLDNKDKIIDWIKDKKRRPVYGLGAHINLTYNKGSVDLVFNPFVHECPQPTFEEIPEE